MEQVSARSIERHSQTLHPHRLVAKISTIVNKKPEWELKPPKGSLRKAPSHSIRAVSYTDNVKQSERARKSSHPRPSTPFRPRSSSAGRPSSGNRSSSYSRRPSKSPARNSNTGRFESRGRSRERGSSAMRSSRSPASYDSSKVDGIIGREKCYECGRLSHGRADCIYGRPCLTCKSASHNAVLCPKNNKGKPKAN